MLAPTGKAVDEAMAEGAGDHGMTVAKALNLIGEERLTITGSTLLVVDEAAMLGTPDLKKLVTRAVAGRAKIVLVGDAYQLAPVKARGGMFEHLCADLPWSQRLGEVWRMADPEERDTSLALRAAHGNRLRTAIKWYRDNDRLHTGDPIAMAADALDAYLDDTNAGKDALLICDTWEMADALNRRLHDTLATPGPTLTVARDQKISVGDIVMSRANDATITLQPSPAQSDDRVDQVRNGNRWRVAAINPATKHIAAQRLTDRARTMFSGDYLNDHITLGYAATVHSAQGVTADSSYALLGEGSSRAMLYVAMTRGRHTSEAFMYQRFSHEGDHDHTAPLAGDSIHVARRGNRYSAAHIFRTILANDDRPRTVHAAGDRTERCLLPAGIANLLDLQDQRHLCRGRAQAAEVETMQRWKTVRERITAAELRRQANTENDGLGM